MSSYQLSALSQVYIFLFIPVIASLVYWFSSGSLNVRERVLSSAHGLIFVLASFFAVFISGYTETGDSSFSSYIFLFIIFLGVISVVYSFLKYPKASLVHLLHFPNVICAFFIFFIGGMTIAHDWI